MKYLQSKDIIKAKELFQKRESFSSLINLGVLAFIEGNFAEGYANISKVIHNESYRVDLLETLGLQNITLSENEIAEMFIADLLTEIPATKLLSAVNNSSDKAIISEKAVNEPIAEINAAISAAKSVNSKDANANLTAGMVLMNSTKTALKQVRDIVGVTSTKYQMVADNLAKQILQCGINYYNNASDDDVESPRKAMPLQAYALQIAIGQLTKDRCQENYDILKKAVDDMPPAEVAIETRKVKEELRRFCQQPDKISHSTDGLDLGGTGAAAGAAISLAMISHTLTIPFELALPRGERSPYCMRHRPSASMVLFDRRQGNMILSLHNDFWQISPGFPGKGDQTT